jgi:hypothetical protein
VGVDGAGADEEPLGDLVQILPPLAGEPHLLPAVGAQADAKGYVVSI